jgi:hypothetical protein
MALAMERGPEGRFDGLTTGPLDAILALASGDASGFHKPMTSQRNSLLLLHTAVLLVGGAGLFGKWIAADPVVIVCGRTARPKRLRFVLFNTLGRVIRHARETLLRSSFDLNRHLLDAARTQIHRPVLALVVRHTLFLG